ncbi:MAG: CDP-glucose 4,6-dehydratase [Smithellaceae bacterium]|nr:CDP-glucose 4,6-dehydratase [Smithellaceae bacterium]
MFNDVYRGKKVLVTGHTGFKGSWLALWLRELGAEVVGYALAPPSVPSNFEACRLKEKIVSIEGDVRDLDHLLEVFRKYEPEYVFHLAAQALVRPSYQDPKRTFDTNIGGTVNVMEAVRLTPKVRVVVNVTSDKCYENREWLWGYRENDPLGGHDPYSASKGGAEIVFSAYQRSFFRKGSAGREIGAASARAGNVVGGGDWGTDRLIPDCIRALSAAAVIDIRNPLAIRPWQHVLEPLSGYLLLGARLGEDPEAFSGAWNFGPAGDDQLNVKEVVDRVVKLWGKGSWRDVSVPGALHEARTLALCCDKALAQLRWQSTLSIEETLAMLVSWYRDYYENRQGPDMYDKCCAQIEKYVAFAKERRMRLSL